MSVKNCSNKSVNRKDPNYYCNDKRGLWMIKPEYKQSQLDINGCSKNSRLRTNDKYHCDPKTHLYKLKPEYAHVLVNQQGQVAPKVKVPTAFIIFSQTMRPEIKKQNPELSFVEISHEIGNLWRNLDADDKQPYIDAHLQYKQRKTEVYQQMGSLVHNVIDRPAHMIKVKGQRHRFGQKGVTGRNIYGKQVRTSVKQQHPELAPHEITALISQKWKSLNAQDKAKYEQQAELFNKIKQDALLAPLDFVQLNEQDITESVHEDDVDDDA